MTKVEEFSKERERLNEIIMKYGGQGIKRFYSLDDQVYREGVLDKKTKELIGLVASLVLRCDDCIKYHVIECHKAGASTQEFEETMTIGLIVGGSIVIPHMRRAFEFWEEIRK